MACTSSSMLPAAISCSSGFHRCRRALSMRVMCALRRRPSLLPRRVASSSPPSPPPTTTTRCPPSATVLLVKPNVCQVLVGEMRRYDLPALHGGDGRDDAGIPQHRHAVGLFDHHALHSPSQSLAVSLVGGALELVVDRELLCHPCEEQRRFQALLPRARAPAVLPATRPNTAPLVRP